MPGPRELVLVRHGESVGNVAAGAAQRAGLEVIDLETRDADTPLSSRGEEQATALRRWWHDLPTGQRPDVVWSSPYVRAVRTAELALAGASDAPVPRLDERLRDRELGVLDLLTTAGVEARQPQESARRRHLGKFYHRPPGGESWADLVLRVRSFLGDLDREADGRRVLLVAHDAVLMSVRYVCEGLTEREVLDLARREPVLNAAVTRLVRDDDATWRPVVVNDTTHLDRQDAPVTEHPGDRDALPH